MQWLSLRAIGQLTSRDMRYRLTKAHSQQANGTAQREEHYVDDANSTTIPQQVAEL